MGGLNGHRVIVVDGTGISMPDTKENQNQCHSTKVKNQIVGSPMLPFSSVSTCIMEYLLAMK